ncbi:MAG TPA: hypothetical protein VMR14_23555 [Streptosporangiaceae bacterium]|nr:hypothetical protein [Streptosporangiaceae bacterium]
MKSAAVCCDRCPAAVTVDTSHFARRRLLKAAVFAPAQAVDPDSVDRRVYRSVTGTILDVSPHFVTIGHAAGERRFALTADATAWRGEPLEPSALAPGDEAIIRIMPSQPGIADRIWANIGRVCGTIMECDSQRLVVHEGAMRRPKLVVISPLASVRIKVRIPNLRPGYLVDIIGVWQRDELHGLIATSPQPTYRSDHMPAVRPVGGRLPEAITGSAVWHDPGEEPYGVLGAFYPAVDPTAGCAEDSAARISPGEAQAFRELPYLAIGSALQVRNECTGIAWTLPVTGCAPVARMFNDHCVTCKTSPRGRVADLTVSSFIALGGELEQGCFNATLTIGR